MDPSDDVNILKIRFEEEDDDDVSLWYLSEEKKDHCLQREVRKVIMKYLSTVLVVEIHDQRRPTVIHKISVT